MIAHPQFAETTFIPVADVNITAIFSELNYELECQIYPRLQLPFALREVSFSFHNTR